MTTNLDLKKIFDEKLGEPGFGDYLRAARASRDQTQVAMAKFIGIPKGMLCDIEKGRQLVSPELAVKIAQKCKLSVSVAVQCALQDQLNKAKIKFKVQLVA